MKFDMHKQIAQIERGELIQGQKLKGVSEKYILN